MTIHVKESTIIIPAQETPKHCLAIPDVNFLVRSLHSNGLYFYRQPNGSANFFESGVLKEALSKVLVPFYPLAGRFGRGENGRIHIQCNGEGVLFVEAETSYAIDDFGDFAEVSNLKQFVPTVDTTKDMSSNPLVLAQVTHFKCGGASLGFGVHHTLADGISIFHFITSWAEMACGLPISIPPCFDSSLLSVGVPSSPKFHHVEYDPYPTMNTPTQNPEPISTANLKLSLDKINTLKAIAKNDHGSGTIKYTRFEVIAAHIWRCMCKARQLPDDQPSKLRIPVNGRPRLIPPLPSGFVGSVVFPATPVALSGNIISESLNSTIERIYEALKRMDDEYLKSALAYLKQVPDLTPLTPGNYTYKSPNLDITDVSRMPIYNANFGWGRPIFMRRLDAAEGVSTILPSPSNDGGLVISISLETHQIQLFKRFFYEIFEQ